MEQEPTPEFIYVQCERCGENAPVTDETTSVQLYIDGNSMKYSFAVITHGTCEPMYKFLDIQDAHTLGYLSNIYVKDKPDGAEGNHIRSQYKHWRAGQMVVAPEVEVRVVEPSHTDLEESWSYFWHDYDPQPYEFQKHRR